MIASCVYCGCLAASAAKNCSLVSRYWFNAIDRCAIVVSEGRWSTDCSVRDDSNEHRCFGLSLLARQFHVRQVFCNGEHASLTRAKSKFSAFLAKGLRMAKIVATSTGFRNTDL